MNSTIKKIIIGSTAALAALVAGYFLLIRKRTPPKKELDNSKKSSPQKSAPAVAEKPAAKKVGFETPKEETIVKQTPLAPSATPTPNDSAEVLDNTWKQFVNNQLGISFDYTGYVVPEKGECFYLLKLYTHDTESYTHIIVQPHEGSSLQAFLEKSFNELKLGLNIEAKDLKLKERLVNGMQALEAEYTYVYPQNITQKYWSVVVALNNNIYLFQHFSPQLQHLDHAKKILSTLKVFEAQSIGSMSASVDCFEFEMTSLNFRKGPLDANSKKLLANYVTVDGTRAATVARAIQIQDSAASTLEELVKEQLALNHKERAPIKLANNKNVVSELKLFDYTIETDNLIFDATDICLVTPQKGYVFTVKQLQTPENQAFRNMALKKLAQTLIVKDSKVSSDLFTYSNMVYSFAISFPAENVTLFTEHLGDDPLITFWHMDDDNILVETNVICVTPDAPARNIEEVKDLIKEGITQSDENGKVEILKESNVTVNGVEGVQFIYTQEIQYSMHVLKWMFTSLVWNGKVYHVRSYAFENQWTKNVEALATSIHSSFKFTSN